ncbi:hypothetical protein PAECIP111893_02642 [Paenibacillus plantiphilus]|uniref:Uncharacterized protein n=1 Tax=Paenibacillus plantiphilus TaxID=2905650 RepID=A0ABN8GEI4_9BACL|nr:hypothetical protein [Paenibacillus plantiphilus]CAH1206896.1 hypothetical protein PAECIP111893_02642 [Paenibacillus plantiphilus]
MLGVAGIIAAAGVIILLQVPVLRKKKLKKELWAFWILLLLGVGISISKSILLNIPTPMSWIAIALKPFSDFLIHIGLIK